MIFNYLGIFWFRISIRSNMKEIPMVKISVIMKIRMVIWWLLVQIALDLVSLCCELLKETTENETKWMNLSIGNSRCADCTSKICVCFRTRCGDFVDFLSLLLSVDWCKTYILQCRNAFDILQHFPAMFVERILADMVHLVIEVWL